MQYALQVFHDDDHEEFRVIDRNGEPWFVLADVCRSLEIGNPSDAARRLDDDEKDTLDNIEGIKSGISPRMQFATIINESGLYSLILTSRKPAAKRFKKWVTAEVLPAIRKTGSYRASPQPSVPAFIRRFNMNWDRVDPGYFSVISELTVRVWGRLEAAGYVMPDKALDGKELRPDVSVGRTFSDWLKKKHPTLDVGFTYYSHLTPETEVEAKQYPNSMMPLFLEFVDQVWIPEYAEAYFKKRAPSALPYLPRLLPSHEKPKTGMIRQPTRKKFGKR